MDMRTALPSNTQLNFPGLRCNIISEIGRGKNAIVYRAWYADHYHTGERHEALIKELFPLDPSEGIYRGPNGGVIREQTGEETYERHRESFEAGNAAHLALLKKRPDDSGANINTYSLNNTLYTVLGFNGGRSMSEELKGAATALRPLVERMLKLLDALEGFHENKLLHLDIAPDNIILLGRGHRERVMLIDYNSCQRIDEARRPSALFSNKQGYTAPEVYRGDYQDIGPGTDLYSVAAVFFRGITGEALKDSETILRQPPDISHCPCMANMPDTVVSWTRTILRRGLHVLAKKRYQSVGDMRQDLTELLDRIDGVGITHSSLWEAGRRNILRMVRDNPSLAFIREADSLYPSNARLDGETASVGELLKRMAASGESALLIAGGGMGKTTAMLRSVLEQTERYVVGSPATAYVSLYGWQSGERDYILNCVLETLRFKPETRSMEDARKALLELLDQPLSGSRGNKPVLLLMLDGLNEATGERQGLIDEILRLSSMPGVAILTATRADEAALPFKRLEMCELEETDVARGLADAGLLMPEAVEIRRLLSTPLMLSIFIQSSLAEQRQLIIKTQDELMAAYFAALREKETASMPDNAEGRWQIEAALDYVLPSLARELNRRNQALEDTRLLPVVENCWNLLNSRLLRRAFPRWIGHSAAIRGDARNAEEWYGRIVHDLLWKRMGLLIRDDQRRYQVSHQIIEEYLLKRERENHGQIERRQRIRRIMIGMVVALALCGGVLVIREATRLAEPEPYPLKEAETVFEYATKAYEDAMEQYRTLHDAVEEAREGPESYTLTATLPKTTDTSGAREDLFTMVSEGQLMPWSDQSMDQKHCMELLDLPDTWHEEYATYLKTLNWVMTDESAYQRFVIERGYTDALSTLLDTDAQIAGTLYDMVCLPHLTGNHEAEPATAAYDNRIVKDNKEGGNDSAEGEDDLVERLETLEDRRRTAEKAVAKTAAVEAESDR